ncbi:MAG: hypothetical protein ACTSUE_13925 [Promethearchaeota archaeon]
MAVEVVVMRKKRKRRKKKKRKREKEETTMNTPLSVRQRSLSISRNVMT